VIKFLDLEAEVFSWTIYWNCLEYLFWCGIFSMACGIQSICRKK